ncbi:MAG: hypothetical protein SFY81_12740 [Verrucomicrobiota bacterium]|nr:hypothetical protein [Verrucomicrobiota bacterium]
MLHLSRSFLLLLTLALPALTCAADKPVYYYNRHFNALGEPWYHPDGNYSQVLSNLNHHFSVRADLDPLSSGSLDSTRVLMLVNLSAAAAGTNPPPNHLSDSDIELITRFVEKGGALIFLSNQPQGHNLEMEKSNQLLEKFGIQMTNNVTDAKKLLIPKGVPIVGGLRWAYYTGNSLLLDPSHPAAPRPLVKNDLNQKPIAGTRDAEGVLAAIAEPGKGRVVIITDAGSIADFAFLEQGVGGVAIKGQDNMEFFNRLVQWAARIKFSEP